MHTGKSTHSIRFVGLILVAAATLSLIPGQAWAPPDSDGDGVANNRDLCPGTPTGQQVDGNGCSLSQLDSDGDTVSDAMDICPDTPAGVEVDSAGCPDMDGDTYFADVDCDDSNPAVNQAAAEICTDGIDNNCNGNIDSADGACAGGGALDADADGLSDTTEQAGVILSPDLTLLRRNTSPAPQTVACTDATGSPATCYFLPPCTGSLAPNDPARALCVDPATPDLFVVAARATGCSASDCQPLYDNDGSGTAESNLPTAPPYNGSSSPHYFDPFAVISSSQGAANNGGLGVAIHECIQDASSTNQHIIDEAYAVRAGEDLSTGSTYLGLSTPGVPGPMAALTIWTEKIKQSIYEKCNSVTVDGIIYPVTTCEDAVSGISITIRAEATDPGPTYAEAQTVLWPLFSLYIQNILSHELGHTVNLVPDQLHYPSGSHVMMEIRIDADATVRRNGAVKSTLYISEDYHSDSKANFLLK